MCAAGENQWKICYQIWRKHRIMNRLHCFTANSAFTAQTVTYIYAFMYCNCVKVLAHYGLREGYWVVKWDVTYVICMDHAPLDCTRAPAVLSNCLKAETIQAPLRLRSRCTSPLGARRCQHQKTNGWSQVRLCLIKISAVLLLQFANNMITLQGFLN